MTEPTQSAIVALFPRVDAVVSAYRKRMDPAAAWGVPAHVTVLYPFVPPHALGAYVEERVEAEVARLPGVDFDFSEVRWFDEEVLYLHPEPHQWFRDATLAIFHAFPDYEPYEGKHEDPVPHLTIGDGAATAALEQVAAEIAAKLPIRERLDHLALMTGTAAPDSWSIRHEFPLGVW